jgi:acetyl-CoA carboxylase biotin carboxylase subunit
VAIRRLFIANRGEIAVRIHHAAKALGMTTIQAYSEADADMLAVRLADEAVAVGPPHPRKSYLNAEALIQAAQRAGADAVHPGYGFLSENADFADGVEGAGLVFVGPKGDTIRKLGDKVTARAVAKDAGVPVVPGSEGGLADLADAKAVAATIGYPVMIKAAAGGGGRGIRVADHQEDLERHFTQAGGEAAAAFGDGRLYLEKLIRAARHVEVQVLGDGERAVHGFERECSLQRRRQKVWEEAPAAVLSETVRTALCDSAVALAQQVGYRGAGTLEYLYDERDERFYFIEMNTRIQVEHPVTEMITDMDLILEQIRVAAGGELGMTQADVKFHGHAIECRLNAENPVSFRPSPGKILHWHPPGGPGVRVDSGAYQGYTIPPHYDSLVGKLIVHGKTRTECLMRLKRALDELIVDGIETTLPLFRALVREPAVIDGNYHIHWLEEFLAKGGMAD